MKAAVLFDSAEEDTRRNRPKLCGQEIYLYALKTFYIHSDIDHIFYLCGYEDALAPMLRHISAWKRESGINKPVTVLRGIRSFTQIWPRIPRDGQGGPKLYVIHDVRFPMATGEMITDAVRMAQEYGVCMFSGDVEDELYQIDRGRLEVLRNTRYLRYPAAVAADSPALHRLDEPRLILEELAHYEPYLCEDTGENIPVYGRWDMEKAEAVMRSRDGRLQNAFTGPGGAVV